MRWRLGAVAAAVLAGALPVASAAPPAGSGPTTIVVCAPGYPGSTGEATSVMDQFADALAAASGQARGALAAEYHETEAGGIERLSRADAGILFAPLPFFLQHEAALLLKARAQAVMEGGEPSEVFALVAGKGKVGGPGALAGWEIQSAVGYAPRFVRGPVLGGWGELPATAKVTFSGAVLSALRRSAAGEKVAVVLDRAQAAGLASLPYGADLEILTRSAPLPALIVATVRDRVTPARAAEITKALLGLASRPDGAAALANLRLTRFVPLDGAGLEKAHRAYAAAAATP
jgi:hypothetical protein